MAHTFSCEKHQMGGAGSSPDEGCPACAREIARPKDRDACIRELGYAWIYMHYLRPGWLSDKKDDCTQRQKKRVKQLMMECAVNWNTQVPDFWVHFYGRIEAEIENMC